ncbi:hypothetical protein DUI87_15491 [Hirundo rustica rustica]|uniref:Uncharacterized protein n=1 Tax=Hirundo rustica rustica TaxID=333673 RepID=A0A3M0K411_HIRRU|nr:hypothetical protein DUI87_15491 [Hirundo rustica rustica]
MYDPRNLKVLKYNWKISPLQPFPNGIFQKIRCGKEEQEMHGMVHNLMAVAFSQEHGSTEKIRSIIFEMCSLKKQRSLYILFIVPQFEAIPVIPDPDEESHSIFPVGPCRSWKVLGGLHSGGASTVLIDNSYFYILKKEDILEKPL